MQINFPKTFFWLVLFCPPYERAEQCQVWNKQKLHEFVEKVPNQELDTLPEVVIPLRLQVFAQEQIGRMEITKFFLTTNSAWACMGGEPWEHSQD